MKIQSPTPEMTEFFVSRTKYHISLVQTHMVNLTKILPYGKELIERGKRHDESKWSEEEMIPYIWLTHFHKCKRDGHSLVYPPGVEKAIKLAITHHVTHNRHHHEFHQNPNNMTEIDLIEMVCDWTAMSQELNQDNHSAKGWADKVVGKKIILNNEKSIFLYNTITLLDSVKA
jgi:hypothetical protein